MCRFAVTLPRHRSLMFTVRQPVRLHRRLLLLFVALTAVAAIGCQKADEIAHYRVPKEQEVSLPSDAPETAASESPAENTAADAKTDRMLAAIVPHGDTAWFFKLSGPVEAVGKQADTFQSLIKSIGFPKSGGGKPTWKLPEGWHEKPGSQMRFRDAHFTRRKCDGFPRCRIIGETTGSFRHLASLVRKGRSRAASGQRESVAGTNATETPGGGRIGRRNALVAIIRRRKGDRHACRFNRAHECRRHAAPVCWYVVPNDRPPAGSS